MISEQEKYHKCWEDPRYADYSPGEWALPLFKHMVRKRTGTLVDLGCGTGRAGVGLAKLGFKVSLLDFASNQALDKQAWEIPFIEQDLSKTADWSPDWRWDWGYCCDVMEHLPPEQVNRVLWNLIDRCKQIFFTIHFGPDQFGAVVGHPLHLSVHPFTWWRDTLSEFGTVTEARDLMGMGAFRLER